MSRLQCEPPRAVAAGNAAGNVAGAIGAITTARVGGELLAASTREHLNHSTQRVGAVQTGCRATQDLDAFDLIERNRLERSRPCGRRAHAQSIDQHQRVIAIGTTKKDPGNRTPAAVHHDFNTGLARQQFGQALRASTGYVLRADHSDVRDQFGQRLR